MSSPKRRRVTACPTLVDSLPLPVDVIQLIQVYLDGHTHCSECTTCQPSPRVWLAILAFGDHSGPKIFFKGIFYQKAEALRALFQAVQPEWLNLPSGAEWKQGYQRRVDRFQKHPTLAQLREISKKYGDSWYSPMHGEGWDIHLFSQPIE